MTSTAIINEIVAVQRRYRNNKVALKKATTLMNAARREYEKRLEAVNRYKARLEKALDELDDMGVRADQKTFNFDTMHGVRDGEAKKGTEQPTVIRIRR